MKLEITRCLVYDADFTVISDNGITGQELSVGDTAYFTISTNGVNPKAVVGLVNRPLSIIDSTNGVFNMLMSIEETRLLTSEVGFGEDKYPTIANYTLAIEFNLASGNRTAYADLYVKDIGICQQ